MKKEKLLHHLTGEENPKRISERENFIIDKCLEIINNLENENNKIYEQIQHKEIIRAGC